MTWVAYDLADRQAVERLAAAHAHRRLHPSGRGLQRGLCAARAACRRARQCRLLSPICSTWRASGAGGASFSSVPEACSRTWNCGETDLRGRTPRRDQHLRHHEALLRAPDAHVPQAVRPRRLDGQDLVGLWAARSSRTSPARGPIPSFLIGALKGEERRRCERRRLRRELHLRRGRRGRSARRRPARQTLDHDIYHLGPGRSFSAREVAEAVKSAVPGAVINLGPGTLPWTTYTALRGPLAGERLPGDTGCEVGHCWKTASALTPTGCARIPNCTGSRDAVLAATDEASAAIFFAAAASSTILAMASTASG